MESVKKRQLYKIFRTAAIFTVLFICACALLIMPERVTGGARKGLTACSNILIPSLFPFLVLCAFVSSPAISVVIGKFLNPLTRALFGLPGECGSVILMSAVGGFPVGAKMTADLYGRGLIAQKEAHRLLSFCVNAGPAFVITAVGSVMLGSKSAGVLIFTAVTLSMLTIGILSGFFGGGQDIKGHKREETPVDSSLAYAFTSAVSGAAESMFSICAWMILFSCAVSVLEASLSGAHTKRLVLLFAEVTTGAGTAAQSGNIALLSAVIGFGGFCVHCQILPFIQTVGMPYIKFFTYRVLNSMLSYAFAKLLIIFFPQDIAVGVSTDVYLFKAFSVSAPAAAALLFMCAILILDTRRRVPDTI